MYYSLEQGDPCVALVFEHFITVTIERIVPITNLTIYPTRDRA
jgi:hypothetical protein